MTRRIALMMKMMVIGLSLAATGCNGIYAFYTVRPPNHGKSLAKVDVPFIAEYELTDAEVSAIPTPWTMRLEVDEGAVSLWVTVWDPSNERLVDAEAEGGAVFEPLPNGAVLEREPRGTILILPGFHDRVDEPHYVMWARIFAAEGYRVVAFDQRGHGRSTGEYSTFGVLESRDTMAVLEAVEAEGLLAEPIGIYARSFGSSTAALLAESDDRIRAIVMVSAFTSMREVIPDFGRTIGFKFDDERYKDIIDRAGRKARFDPDASNAAQILARIDLPVLIVHGEDDELIPVQHAVRLYQAAGRDNVELIRVAGVDHTTLGKVKVEPIRQPALDWFERYLHLDQNDVQQAQRSDEQRSIHP